ncbi:MAG: gamma-glutamylcyclotransferase family protein [Cyclobacteriaceae bacterium]
MAKIIHYFAYGSNMSIQRMNQRLVNYQSRKPALLKGYQLVFNKINRNVSGAGFANIMPVENSWVEGVVYEIEEAGLKILDGFEGYPNRYSRQILPVEVGNQITRAHTYIAHKAEIADGLKPEIIYLRYLLDAKDLLSADYYFKLETLQSTLK